MKTPKALAILKTFDENEWIEFRKYYPFRLGTDTELAKFCKWIIKNKKHIDECNSNQEIFNKYKIGIKLQSFTNLMTILSEVLDGFLIYQEYNQIESLKAQLKLKAYTRRGDVPPKKWTVNSLII